MTVLNENWKQSCVSKRHITECILVAVRKEIMCIFVAAQGT
jgi:hypothetical protein